MTPVSTPSHDAGIIIDRLEPFYGSVQAVKAVTMQIAPRQITAIIGPSGCGKSTVLRCLNRMHEITRGARAQGHVWVNGEDVYAPGLDPVLVRRRIGMVFQQPIALRTRSVYENVAIGPRLGGIHNRRMLDEIVERSLRAAALWDEVKDKLQLSGLSLSGGQQQRLSIARTLAVEPEIILLDEPCSALDPIATAKIEELLLQLRERYTLVIVTHNLSQATRISDSTAVFLVERTGERPMGALVEYAPTQRVFTQPHDPRTEAYITGKMG